MFHHAVENMGVSFNVWLTVIRLHVQMSHPHILNHYTVTANCNIEGICPTKCPQWRRHLNGKSVENVTTSNVSAKNLKSWPWPSKSPKHNERYCARKETEELQNCNTLSYLHNTCHDMSIVAMSYHDLLFIL